MTAQSDLIAALHVAPADLVELAINLDDRLLPPYTFAKCLYYAARMESLLSLPALVCLYMALRVFYRQCVDDMAHEAEADAPGREERP